MFSSLTFTYIVVFLATLLPAGWLVAKAIKVVRVEGWRSWKSLGWLVIAAMFWFSPSLASAIQGFLMGAPLWVLFLIVTMFMCGVVTFVKKLSAQKHMGSTGALLKELAQVLLLMAAGLILKVQYLAPDDPKAMNLISRFRGAYVTWTEATSGVPRELDRYDGQPTTVHVAVFLRLPFKDLIIGYGRLLFECNQMREKYTEVLEGVEVDPVNAVEISRLLVVPSIYGYQIRNTKWSLVVQMLIYRSFFQICEIKGVSEWWAVLGAGLQRLLNSFGFPFQKVNNLTGKDSAGIYYAVRMYISQGRESVKANSPLLYRWFCAVLNRPVRFVRMNGRQTVPVTESHASA